MTAESRWIFLLSALTLLIGILIGIAMDRFLFLPRHPFPPHYMGEGPHGGRWRGERALARLTQTLNLTEDQRAKIRPIFRKYMPQFREARWKGEDTAGIRRKMRADMAKVLTPAQLQKFDEVVKRRREMRERYYREEMPPTEPPHRP